MTHEEMLMYAQKAERALKDAFVNLVKERRKTGESLILWENGKVVEIPATEIPDSALNYTLTVQLDSPEAP